MSDQLDLLAPTHIYDGPESRSAARKVNAVDQFHRVLVTLLRAGEPLTDDEIARRSGLLRHSAGTRRGVAVKRGLVRQMGVGKSALGNRAAQWTLTDEGYVYASQLRLAS